MTVTGSPRANYIRSLGVQPECLCFFLFSPGDVIVLPALRPNVYLKANNKVQPLQNEQLCPSISSSHLEAPGSIELPYFYTLEFLANEIKSYQSGLFIGLQMT